nr:uncharacterized protein LOC123745214 [Procambarus clarkii]
MANVRLLLCVSYVLGVSLGSPAISPETVDNSTAKINTTLNTSQTERTLLTSEASADAQNSTVPEPEDRLEDGLPSKSALPDDIEENGTDRTLSSGGNGFGRYGSAGGLQDVPNDLFPGPLSPQEPLGPPGHVGPPELLGSSGLLGPVDYQNPLNSPSLLGPPKPLGLLESPVPTQKTFIPGQGYSKYNTGCKHYCPGFTPGSFYCCNQAPSLGRPVCPPLRESCPDTFRHSSVRFCIEDRGCQADEKCCLDVCIQRHVCKSADWLR